MTEASCLLVNVTECLVDGNEKAIVLLKASLSGKYPLNLHSLLE